MAAAAAAEVSMRVGDSERRGDGDWKRHGVCRLAGRGGGRGWRWVGSVRRWSVTSVAEQTGGDSRAPSFRTVIRSSRTAHHMGWHSLFIQSPALRGRPGKERRRCVSAPHTHTESVCARGRRSGGFSDVTSGIKIKGDKDLKGNSRNVGKFASKSGQLNESLRSIMWRGGATWWWWRGGGGWFDERTYKSLT